jgi:hypothetical protein
MYTQIIRTLIVISVMIIGANAYASRFSVLSPYSCSDSVKTCQSRGEREVDGMKVSKDCWQWSYVKTCNYPSKNYCHKYTHCYWVANRDCLLKDLQNNCVNLVREFSCKRWEDNQLEKEKVLDSFGEGVDRGKLVCKGLPCLDGNCVDKSYETNGEMMDSISKLHAAKSMKPGADMTFALFSGYDSHCSKKITEYTNCCAIKGEEGWGKELGAKCTKDENSLRNKREKNLCVYVGKEKKETAGVVTVNKHYFCCFGNMLDKVVQVEGRKQLGKNFGSGSSPDCSGLSMEDIQRLDFSKIDFSEFIDELKLKFAKTYKGAKPGDLDARIQGSIGNIRKGDNDSSNKANNSAGWREDYITGEDEKSKVLLQHQREEELRAAEAARQEELRKESIIQAEQKEKLRILEEEQKETARLGELKAQRRVLKERELAKLRNELSPNNRFVWWLRFNKDKRKEWEQKIRVIEQDLASGNY